MSPSKLPQAVACFQQGDFAGARRLCQQILRRESANVGAWHLLGVACLSMGEAQSALDALKRAHVYATNDAAITENLAVAHLAAGEASVAEALLSHLIARGATSGLLHMRHGLALPCNNWGGCLKRNRRCVWRCKPRPVKPMFM